MSFITNKTNKIYHRFSCNDKCLIYLLTGQKCQKQREGKKVDHFRLRCNNYKDNLRKFFTNESCMQQHLFQHFGSEGHHGFLDKVDTTFIDKTDSNIVAHSPPLNKGGRVFEILPHRRGVQIFPKT